jgi:tetratricopeptide (TPR) repeat protein
LFTEVDFVEYLAKMEGSTLDFKARGYNLSDEGSVVDLMKDVLSMANTPRDQTSYIILGVKKHSDGRYELWGLDSHPDEANLQQQFSDRVTPIPDFTYYPISHAGRQFGVLAVPPKRSSGPFVPMKDFAGSLEKGRIYFRRGSRNDVAWRPEDQHHILGWFADGTIRDLQVDRSRPAWEEFCELVHGFDPARLYILIAAPMHEQSSEALRALGLVSWTFIVDLDPDSDASGLLAATKQSVELHRAVHVVARGDRPNLNRDGAAYWFFARGLAGRHDSLATGRWRDWKNSYGNEINEQFRLVASRFNPTPVTCIIVWSGSDLNRHLQSILEAAINAFDAGIDFVFVSPDPADVTDISDDLDAPVVQLPINQLAAGLESVLAAERELGLGRRLPSSSGAPITLDRSDQHWLEEELEIVDLNAGAENSVEGDVGREFLRGAEVTWFELSLHADIDRDKTRRIRHQIGRDLERRHAVRINLFHAPGAGGSTVARRLLWEFHHEFPCVVLRRTTPEETAERLYRISSLTNHSVLLLADGALVSDREMEDLYSYVRSRHIPVVLLQVLRRFTPHQDRERSLYLPARLSPLEAARFVEAFSRHHPSQRAKLERIAASQDERTCTPFRFGLETFGTEFLGLEKFVSVRLDPLDEKVRFIVRTLAIAHHYAQQSLPAQAFADILSIPRDRVVKLEKALPPSALDLVVEVERGTWRTAHDLIALEVLTQLLLPPGSQDSRMWTQSLSQAAIEFIRFCRQDRLIPGDEFLELVRRALIYRDNVNLLGSERSATKDFSQLLSDIPSREGRLRVLTELVAIFPSEPHFWAHLGRFQAVQMQDYDAATRAIDRALMLEPGDPVLHHMRGMAIRYQVTDLIRERGDLSEAVELAEEASGSFARARELDPENEHAFISEAQMIIRLLDYAGRAYGGVLKYVGSSHAPPYLRNAIEQAEDLLERVRRHREGEGASPYERDARARLDALYGDYSRALQTWDSLLLQGSSFRPPLRRQIAYTYLARHDRNWNKLTKREVSRVVELLEENLHEEGFAERDLRLWVQAVRYLETPPSVEAVIEKVAYWRANSPSIEAIYYLYVLHALLALEGSRLHRADAERALEECRHLARFRRNRTISFEWLGLEEGLHGLVHHSELGEWVKEGNFWENTDRLARIEGRIISIDGPQAGRIEVAGLNVFFVPSAGGFATGRSENQMVELYLGFSYDGLRAWDVTLPE